MSALETLRVLRKSFAVYLDELKIPPYIYSDICGVGEDIFIAGLIKMKNKSPTQLEIEALEYLKKQGCRTNFTDQEKNKIMRFFQAMVELV